MAKINFDKIKGAQIISDALHKTSEISKMVADNVQDSSKDIMEKAESEAYLRQMKKYNPLFPEDYRSNAFNLPNMIVSVDDAERKGIDVCKGAIGWLSTENGMEVLHLYDEWIEECGLNFIPNAVCDAVYYVDSFDRTRFVRVDCIFGKAQEEKLAELKYIANSLGAKRCSIEIEESSVEIDMAKKKLNFGNNINIKSKKIHSNEKAEQDISRKEASSRSGKIVAEFEGNANPIRPQLKWFMHDENIKHLIEIRCDGSNPIKSEMFKLEGSASATMSQKTAISIDNAIGKLGSKAGKTMELQATKEGQSKLLYCIEF